MTSPSAFPQAGEDLTAALKDPIHVHACGCARGCHCGVGEQSSGRKLGLDSWHQKVFQLPGVTHSPP